MAALVQLVRVDFTTQVPVPYDSRRTGCATVGAGRATTLDADMVARVVIIDGANMYPFECCSCIIPAPAKPAAAKAAA
jgi:hypothetical protein